MATRVANVELIASSFESLSDPRHTRNRKHLLGDIVVIAVCGLVCGCDGPTAIHRWAANRLDWLAQSRLGCTRQDGHGVSKRRLRHHGEGHHFLRGPWYCSIGGVPWVWKLSMVFSPQAWPFLRSVSVHTTGCQSGASISRAPAFATSTRLPPGS